MEGRIVLTREGDIVLIITVARVIVAVEEHLHLVDATIEKSPDALAAGVVILADLLDQILLIDIVEVEVTARAS